MIRDTLKLLWSKQEERQSHLADSRFYSKNRAMKFRGFFRGRFKDDSRRDRKPSIVRALETINRNKLIIKSCLDREYKERERESEFSD